MSLSEMQFEICTRIDQNTEFWDEGSDTGEVTNLKRQVMACTSFNEIMELHWLR